MLGIVVDCLHSAFLVPEELFLDEPDASQTIWFLSFLRSLAILAAAILAGRGSLDVTLSVRSPLRSLSVSPFSFSPLRFPSFVSPLSPFSFLRLHLHLHLRLRLPQFAFARLGYLVRLLAFAPQSTPFLFLVWHSSMYCCVFEFNLAYFWFEWPILWLGFSVRATFLWCLYLVKISWMNEWLYFCRAWVALTYCVDCISSSYRT